MLNLTKNNGQVFQVLKVWEYDKRTNLYSIGVFVNGELKYSDFDSDIDAIKEREARSSYVTS